MTTTHPTAPSRSATPSHRTEHVMSIIENQSETFVAPAATMRRAVAEPTVGVRLEDSTVPTPGAGEVLVRSTLVGICGSDTHAIAGQHPFLTAAYVPGHEAVGVVVATGKG